LPIRPGRGQGTALDLTCAGRTKRSDKYIEYPIYLAYTAAVLEQAGLDVSFLDAVMDELSIEAFARQVADRKPGLVLLETSTPSIAFDLETAAAVKDASRGPLSRCSARTSPTLTARLWPTIRPSRRRPRRVRAGVRQSGLALQAGGDLSGVLGLTYRDGDEVRANPPQPCSSRSTTCPSPPATSSTATATGPASTAAATRRQ